MGAFQALLLAASLGWSTVVAVPQGPEWSSNATSNNAQPHQHQIPSSLPASIPHMPSSLPASIPAPTHPGNTGPPYPHQTGHPSGSWSGHKPSQAQSNPGTTSGGILVDTAPIPTAIKTYFVNGQPIVAGSATVIKGTTYSLAASGTAFYANGKPKIVSNAIIAGGGRTTATRTGSAVVSASSGAASGPASTGQGAVMGMSGMLVGVVVLAGMTGVLL